MAEYGLACLSFYKGDAVINNSLLHPFRCLKLAL